MIIIVCGDPEYGTCARCGRRVQLNKTLFGSLHFCVSDAEDRSYTARLARFNRGAQQGIPAKRILEKLGPLGSGAMFNKHVE